MHPDLDLNKISKEDAAVCECHNGVCNWSKHIQQCSVGYKWARAPLTQDEQNNLFLFEGKPVASRIWWEMRIFTKNHIEKESAKMEQFFRSDPSYSGTLPI